ncbi:hypothetical protein FQN57_002458 [Myotisia sp. PD_48]|nr:hypothetical protein FQN57_002458 [Myotisia sp. PD_48]
MDQFATSSGLSGSYATTVTTGTTDTDHAPKDTLDFTKRQIVQKPFTSSFKKDFLGMPQGELNKDVRQMIVEHELKPIRDDLLNYRKYLGERRKKQSNEQIEEQDDIWDICFQAWWFSRVNTALASAEQAFR